MAFINDPLWYKDAIIYELHVKAFYDANGDGIGDFRGLIQKLDYLEELGVNTIWLLPFYPSPMRDDGYDIADYHNVFEPYGQRQDVKILIEEVHRRNMRLITELVINHTSDQHPWFQAARKAPKDSSKRNFYVWSDDPQRFADTRIIFTDTEKSNWTWDEEAQAYFWHRFFSHQPDLNFDNPEVVESVIRVMRFWLDMGVDGLRLDAIPYLIEREGTNNENLPETHAIIKHIRAVVDEHYTGRMLLAEANQWPEDVREYFGDGDECHMAYHFPIMPRLYLALAQEDRYPIIDILRQTPSIPENCQWAIFLRNHDELTLEMVTDKERDYMYQMYAADPQMRINVGIRRRLAPLLDNDRDKIELMNYLLMTMPGSPIVYYGDEIGMGDNFFLGDRNGVRTPMQWSTGTNAGFSNAAPDRLYLPVVTDAIYGYGAVNIEGQTHTPSSLLNWMRRLIKTRRNHLAFGRGELTPLAPGNRKIFAYLRTHGDEVMLCVANLSHAPQPVELELAQFKGRVPVELTNRTPFPPIGEMPYLLTLPRYGFLWFEISAVEAAPLWHTDLPSPEDLPILVLTESRGFFLRKASPPAHYDEFKASHTVKALEVQALPRFFQHQHWCPDILHDHSRFDFEAWGDWQTEQGRWLFARVHVESDRGRRTEYFLPLSMKWGIEAGDIPIEWYTQLITRVRSKATVGVVLDAAGDNDFCRVLISAMGHTQDVPLPTGKLHFQPSRAYYEWVDTPDAIGDITRPSLKQSHSTVVGGERLFLKLYRRLVSGLRTDYLIGRFLTDHTPFDRIPPTLGYLSYKAHVGGERLLAVLFAYVENQGNAWEFTSNHLSHSLDMVLSTNPPDHAGYYALMRKAGQRLAELHRALAIPTFNPGFGLEKVAEHHAQIWLAKTREQTILALDRLQEIRSTLPQEWQSDIDVILNQRSGIEAKLGAMRFDHFHAALSRYHGDFHLGRMLVVENDVYITGLDGAATLDEDAPEGKHLPLKDVASLLYSLDRAGWHARAKIPSDTEADCAHLDESVHQWRREAASAVLSSYREAIGNCGSYPDEDRHARQLIQLFYLENWTTELCRTIDAPASNPLSIEPLSVWLNYDISILQEES